MKHSKNHGKLKEKKEQIEHFDYNFTKRILKLSESDPYFALENIKNYLQEYTDDYTLQSTCVSLLVTIGEFEEAKKCNDAFKKMILESEELKTLDNGKKLKRLLINTKYNEFRILANTCNYEKAYNYLLKYKEEFEDPELSRKGFNYSLMTFLQARVGIKFNRDNQRTYACRQAIEFNEEDFFEHIKKHIKGSSNDEMSDSLFFEDVDIKQLYYNAMKILPEQKPLYRGFIDKTYYFKYDACGIIGTEVVDYFKIITYGDNSGVITMCPTKDGEHLPHVDMNYLKENDFAKKRKLTQIDKFNQRYGKK